MTNRYKMTYRFTGYLDSISMASGQLIPVFLSEDGKFYYQKVENEIITGFERESVDFLRHSTFVKNFPESHPIKVGDPAWLVFKVNGRIIYGTKFKIQEEIDFMKSVSETVKEILDEL